MALPPADSWSVHARSVAWAADGRGYDPDGSGVRVVLHDVTAPEGDRFDYPVVHLPRVAVALVVRPRDDGAPEVLVLRTYRYPVNRYGWELPGGGVDDGEDPAAAAAREAAEETGWRPVGPGRPLVAFEPLPGGVATTVHVHLWTEVAPSDVPRDRHEPGRAAWIPLADVPRLAAAGELLGAGTLVGLLQYLVSSDAPSRADDGRRDTRDY